MTHKAKWKQRSWMAIQLLAMLCIAGGSLVYGLQIRRWAWDASREIHFAVSLNNAIRWGQHTNQAGLLKVYPQLVKEFGDTGDYKAVPGALALDYPPLRLLIISKWQAWTEVHFPPQKNRRSRWRSDYEFNRPMLWLNNGCEMAGAIAMFLLVHHWLRICEGAGGFNLQGAWPALFAALLLWFNPAVIFNAHCFPQWDVWILPPFLLAVYLGLRDQWLVAGICIGAVAMGKGQILLVTPVLAIWQICIGKPSAVPRLLIGILLATGAIASPWLVSNPTAYNWMICAVIALVLMLSLFFFRSRSRNALLIHSGVAIVCIGLLTWPWLTYVRPDYFGWSLAAIFALLVSARSLQRQWMPAFFATGLTAGLFACVPLFNTSMAWYTVGIAFSTRHWPLLYWCKAMNLGAILQEDFGWDWGDTIPVHLPFIHASMMPMRYLMIGAYLISLVLCGIGMAMHHRRKSPMFFFAMVAPWVLMFTLLPQMQNRYLVWAAAFSAAAAAFSLDGFVLYLLLAIISVIDTAVDMMGNVPDSATSQKWLPLIDPMFPNLAWAVLLIAGIWLYLALSPGGKQQRVPEASREKEIPRPIAAAIAQCN
jgi:hypothetical protein